MSVTTKTKAPLDLHKTNLQLALRTSKLLKECVQYWIYALGKAVDENIEETSKEIEKIALVDNPQLLAEAPGKTLMHLTRVHMENAQSMTQVAITSQTLFLTGIRDAIQTWQEDSAKAMGNLEAVTSINTAMSKLFNVPHAQKAHEK